MRRAAAVLLLVLAAVFAIPGQANAQTKGHTCQSIVIQGARQAVQCVDFNVFLNSAGDLAVQALGSSLCQQYPPPTDNPTKRCAGILQYVSVYPVLGHPDDTMTVQACGYAGGGQCPAGRLYGYSTGAYCKSNQSYTAYVSTIVDMPITGDKFSKTLRISLSGSKLCTLIG
jgi:hypothetical protein